MIHFWDNLVTNLYPAAHCCYVLGMHTVFLISITILNQTHRHASLLVVKVTNIDSSRSIEFVSVKSSLCRLCVYHKSLSMWALCVCVSVEPMPV